MKAGCVNDPRPANLYAFCISTLVRIAVKRKNISKTCVLDDVPPLKCFQWTWRCSNGYGRNTSLISFYCCFLHLFPDLPTCTYSVRILTLKYTCTNCCFLVRILLHFAIRPFQFLCKFRSMKLLLLLRHNNLHVSRVKSFWPIRVLHLNTLAYLPVLPNAPRV